MDYFKLQLHPQGVTLVLPEADKTNGIRKIAEKCGVAPESLIYVGDSINDYNCLNLVDYPACPKNSDERIKGLVKAKGGYISPYRTLRGSCDILATYGSVAGAYAVVFDFDGCLFDKHETFVDPCEKENLEMFRFLVGQAKPFSRSPLVTINTGASLGIFADYIQQWGFPIFDAYGFTKSNIDQKCHDIWPPMMFEDGLVAYNAITNKKEILVDNPEKIEKLELLTREFKTLLAPEIKRKEYRIPQKDVSLSIDYLARPEDKGAGLSQFHSRMEKMFHDIGREFDFEIELLR